MINDHLTIDDAFQIMKDQLEFLETVQETIKRFPNQEYLHIGFDAGKLKSKEYVYNLEYKMPVNIMNTRFKGQVIEKKTYKVIEEINVPTVEVAEILKDELRRRRTSFDFRLTYRPDKKTWGIKCGSVNVPLGWFSAVYKDKYRLVVDEQYSIQKELSKVIGWSADRRSRNAIGRKSNDIDFYIDMFSELIPAVLNDDVYAVRKVLTNASDSKAINLLK